MRGKEYYYEFRYTGRTLPNGHLEHIEYILDSRNRKTKWTLDDFKKNKKFFICSYNGRFSRIIDISLIKKCIFHCCPWKDTYKDQVLLCYIDEEKYNEDIKKERGEQFNSQYMIFGSDVFDFLEALKEHNEELSNEMSLIVELEKDDGKY